MKYLLMSVLFACASEIDNKEAAQVKESKNKETVEAKTDPVKSGEKITPDDTRWMLDPTSKVEWVGAKVTKDHQGILQEASNRRLSAMRESSIAWEIN